MFLCCRICGHYNKADWCGIFLDQVSMTNRSNCTRSLGALLKICIDKARQTAYPHIGVDIINKVMRAQHIRAHVGWFKRL